MTQRWIRRIEQQGGVGRGRRPLSRCSSVSLSEAAANLAVAAEPATDQLAVADLTTERTVTDRPDRATMPQVYQCAATNARHVRINVTELGRPTIEEGSLGYHRLQLAEMDVLRIGS